MDINSEVISGLDDCMTANLLRCPLANRLQSLPLTFQILRTWAVTLALINGPVAIPRLIEVIIEEARRLGLLVFRQRGQTLGKCINFAKVIGVDSWRQR